MEETLKTIRLLHQVIIALCAALLAFALSPDESASMQESLDELYALRKLDFSKYAAWVVPQHNTPQTFSSLSWPPDDVALSLGTSLEPDFKYEPSFYLEWPDARATLRDWENFMRFATVVRFGPKAPQEIRWPQGMEGNRVFPIKSIKIFLETEDAMPMGDPMLWSRIAKSNLPECDGKVEVTVQPSADKTDSVTIPGKLRKEAIWQYDLPYQWVMSDPELAMKVFSGWFSPQCSDCDHPLPSFLPQAHKYWMQIAHLSLPEATEKMEKRVESAAHGLTLFSISLDIILLRWAGPISTLLFLAYLAVHLNQLQNFPAKSREEVSNFPWIGIFRGWVSVALICITLLLLPLISNGLLIWRTTSGLQRIYALMLVGLLLLAIQAYIARILFLIRRRIGMDRG
jgi:hypothetical protein